MERHNSRILKILGLLLCVFTLSGCTKTIVTEQDKCAILMAQEDYDVGETYGHYGENSLSYTVNKKAVETGYLSPSEEFYTFYENKITAYIASLKNYTDSKGVKVYEGKDDSYLRGIATFGGSTTVDSEGNLVYTKNKLWTNYNMWLEEARSTLGVDKCPDRNYVSYYQSTLKQKVNSYTTTITPVDGEFNGVKLEGKTWKQAFNYGLLEGLLVYPVSWLLYQFSHAFGLNGWGQVAAILLVTVIVRGILILLTFKQTLSQQRMTALNPELRKLQEKYPNSQTNQYEKQRLAQEQMALYKKNKINPLGTIIVMLFQFPIFIAVWGAMQGSAILRTGDLLGLSLAATTSQAMFNFKSLTCIVAWVIFILMAAGQFVSMKVPQWMQKKSQEDVEKLTRNPSQEQSQKTMGMVNNMMLIFIIVMGLSLPVAMAIYWFASSLISLAQTVIMQLVIQKHQKNKKHTKYKTKK